jgi:small-conductance mechanosensitive channel
MISAPYKLLAALLFCVSFPATGFAQEGEGEQPELPKLQSLSGSWWDWFEGAHDEVGPRATEFIDGLGEQIVGLQPQNQEIAQAVLDAVEDNISALVDLLDDTVPAPQVLDAAAEAYSLDELLELAAAARRADSDAADERQEVQREARVLAGATRRRDAAFKDYVEAGAGDARWLSGLRLVQARSAQAISSRRLELLSLSYEQAADYAAAMAGRVDLARERLAATVDEKGFEALVSREVAAAEAVDAAQNNLREAGVAAVGLDLDTIEGPSEQRLEQQRLIDAEVELALAEAELAQAQARRWWTELQLDRDPDLGDFEQHALSWTDLIDTLSEQVLQWTRDTQDELLAVQSIDRGGLDRSLRRLLDQRLGTAQETLGHIGDLEAAIADVGLLSEVTDDAAARYTGAFRSWLISVSRQVKAWYEGLLGLGDYTLFSIGEAPITGGDILRVIIILVVAMLLSKIVRHAIRRVSTGESAGTQASMYTVGRLTHYTIIIIAVFVALSSMGIDFSNLALIAGALGVGLGFGLQAIVSNFVSGLIILFEQTLRVGDYIELDTGLTGTVKAINVRSTLINTNDNIDIVVPNSEFVTTRLTNWTLAERTRRMRIPFGVAYGSDKELVKKAALEAADEVPYTLTHMKGREPDVWLVNYGDSSLDFLLLVWVNRQGARRPTRTTAAYLWALETKLAEYGIEIPFPQRDLHLRSGFGKDAISPAASSSPPASDPDRK